MKKTQRILAFVLTVILLLAVSIPASADYDFAANAKIVHSDYTGKTIILHTNDVHGALSGYAYAAALKTRFENAGAEVLLVDAGDFSQGTTYVSSFKGASAVTMMNAAGYDLVTLGNHEFDYGYAQLTENLKKAAFTVLCADVYLNETGETIYDPCAVVETGSGLKLGFFGMETPETATKVNPGLIKEITFATFDDFYASAQLAVDELKEQEADLVIGLVHLGVDAESAANGYRSVDLYEKGISVSSMSKVFSLAGLRLGWIATHDETVRKALLSHRDYNHISCGMFDEALAAVALQHSERILERNRGIVRENLAVLDAWVQSEPRIHYQKPRAGTTALVYYDYAPDSYAFCTRMYHETGAFVTPGDCFEQPKSMRIGYASDVQTLKDGLAAISAFLRILEQEEQA